VHDLDHNQSNTTKELLDIATRHTSSEEAVKVVFILGNGETIPSANRATPFKANGKGTKKGAKGGKRGKSDTSGGPLSLLVVTMMIRTRTALMRSMSQPLCVTSSAKRGSQKISWRSFSKRPI
jgi:hypothetical protein